MEVNVLHIFYQNQVSPYIQPYFDTGRYARMTDNWHDVATVGTIQPGGFEVVDIDDIMIAVFNIDGQYYAIEDVCTHDGEELTGGPVEDDEIICPRHGARFCIRTGEALSAPAYEPVPTYPVRIENDKIQVQVDT